jgi:hypothetical protein
MSTSPTFSVYEPADDVVRLAVAQGLLTTKDVNLERPGNYPIASDVGLGCIPTVCGPNLLNCIENDLGYRP